MPECLLGCLVFVHLHILLSTLTSVTNDLLNGYESTWHTATNVYLSIYTGSRSSCWPLRSGTRTQFILPLWLISQRALWSPSKVLPLVDGYSYSELRIQSIKWGHFGSRNLVKLLSHWDGSEIFLWILSRWSEVRSLSRQSHQFLPYNLWM